MPSNPEQRRVLKKTKRFRSAFTTEQTNYLEEQYKKFQYINGEQRQKVASILKIGERPIKIWFQNRRMKEKKENHKEFNDEICGNAQKFDKGQLNNVPALPSTNDSRLYSLPILSFTADTTAYANTNSLKAKAVDSKDKLSTKLESPNSTTNIEQKVSPPRANFYKEVISQEHLSPYFHQQGIVDTTVPFTTDEKYKKLPSQEYKSNTSAEFSIDLCKKYKQQRVSTDTAVSGNISHEDKKMKTETKQTPKFSCSKDIPPSKKCKVSPSIQQNSPSYPPPPKPSRQMNLTNAMYYPVMPNVYSPPITSLPPPYVSPDGVLWKPVNFMPVMATNPPPMKIGHQAPSAHAAHEQSKNCICNCHETTQHLPLNFPPSLQNPYAQYVITVPFPHTSASF